MENLGLIGCPSLSPASWARTANQKVSLLPAPWNPQDVSGRGKVKRKVLLDLYYFHGVGEARREQMEASSSGPSPNQHLIHRSGEVRSDQRPPLPTMLCLRLLFPFSSCGRVSQFSLLALFPARGGRSQEAPTCSCPPSQACKCGEEQGASLKGRGSTA